MRTIGAGFEDNQHSTATPPPFPPHPTADLKKEKAKWRDYISSY